MNNLHKITRGIPEPFLALADQFPRTTYVWRHGWLYLLDGTPISRSIFDELDGPMRRKPGKVEMPKNIHYE